MLDSTEGGRFDNDTAYSKALQFVRVVRASRGTGYVTDGVCAARRDVPGWRKIKLGSSTQIKKGLYSRGATPARPGSFLHTQHRTRTARI